MDFKTYQAAAMATAVFPKELGQAYTALGLVNEAGEYAGKVKKILRGDNPTVDRSALSGELGDVLWYLAACAHEFNIDLESVASDNLAKLSDRASRGVLKGSGDNR